MSIKELDGLLSLLEEKKRKMEQQESEMSMEIMLGFLHCLKNQKFEELNEVQINIYMYQLYERSLIFFFAFFCFGSVL